LPKFDLKQLIQFKSEYLADWPAAMYTLSLADASLRAREQMVKDARRDVRDKIASGRAVRNLQITTDSFSGELYKLILLPLWIGTYHYGQHQYRVIINGQTGQVAGDKPLDMPLVTFFILTVLLFLGVLSALMFVMLR
jgi:hypothetical protein